MSDDEIEQHDDVAEFHYCSDDHTVEVQFPKRHLIILPQGVASSGVTIWTLKHPRHEQPCLFLTSPGMPALLELQERRHPFGETWFIDETVEPSSPLFLATPVDMTFFAISLSQRDQKDKYVCRESFLEADKDLAALPQHVKEALLQCIDNICDKKCFGPDESYYRFCEERYLSWVRAKHSNLTSSKRLRELLCIPLDDGKEPLSADLCAALGDKALVLLLEYIPASLHEASANACGVCFAKKAAPTTVMPSHSGAHTDDKHAEPDKKKAKVELKSASVKRLEKAGPPKGTPTLMAMFAKKQQKDEAAKAAAEANQPQ